MGLVKWFRRCGEKVRYAQEERGLREIGLTRVRHEREYPLEPGSIDGIALDHLYRYDLAKPYCHDKTVMDYGCGVGYGAFVLSEVAARAVGFDISPDALAWAAHYASRRQNLSYTGELPNDEFDCITCFECIEHVPNPEEILDWLASHCLHQLFISTPDASGGRTKNAYHLREFTRDEFREMLGSRFAIEEETSQGGPHNVMIFRCRPLCT